MKPGRMSFRRGSRDEPEINLIPFIDVLLVVLIFLMLSTTYSKFTEMQLTLPVADVDAQRDHPKEAIVSIAADGRYSVNRSPLADRSLETVTAALGAAMDGKDGTVIISADANSPHQSVITVMEAARRAGRTLTLTASGPPRAWHHRGKIARALWPLSQVYRALVAIRGSLYKAGWLASESVGVPVVVVGNVIAGGAGKTPVVIAVVRHARSLGIQVGVVSRGYGRQTADCREVLADSDPKDVGDEPAMLRRITGVPVFVARKRTEAARALLAKHPDVRLIVADDGLQHLAMQRDVEICVFDDRGVGNGWLLPAGMLREPWPRACDLLIHTGDRPAFPGGFRSQRALADHALRRDGTRVPLRELCKSRAPPIVAVAAIARPEAFFSMLRARGLRLTRAIALKDHHDFGDWEAMPSIDGKTPILLCTEKDAVKLWRVMPDALAVPLVFTPEPRFFEALDAKLSSADGHQAA